VYRKSKEESTFKLAGTTMGDDTTYVDDISDYRESVGSFCYYVVAIEGSNPVGYAQDNGQPFFSRSNESCINQGAKVYMATAFRPGSDVIENRTYGPSMKFNEVSEYHFYIMNRWGVKVFETFDPTEKWDGTYNNSEAQQGVYIYFLRYSAQGAIPKEERGDFTLIR
jgi:gliding motility-associated-like protein